MKNIIYRIIDSLSFKDYVLVNCIIPDTFWDLEIMCLSKKGIHNIISEILDLCLTLECGVHYVELYVNSIVIILQYENIIQRMINIKYYNIYFDSDLGIEKNNENVIENNDKIKNKIENVIKDLDVENTIENEIENVIKDLEVENVKEKVTEDLDEEKLSFTQLREMVNNLEFDFKRCYYDGNKLYTAPEVLPFMRTGLVRFPKKRYERFDTQLDHYDMDNEFSQYFWSKNTELLSHEDNNNFKTLGHSLNESFLPENLIMFKKTNKLLNRSSVYSFPSLELIKEGLTDFYRMNRVTVRLERLPEVRNIFICEVFSSDNFKQKLLDYIDKIVFNKEFIKIRKLKRLKTHFVSSYVQL
jgi:hypothetical protein